MASRLRLYYPVKPFLITQKFAQSEACVDGSSTLPPARRKVVGKTNGVCPVGWVELYPLLGMVKGHTGLDIRAWHGQPVYASHDGVVEEISTEVERGLGVGIVSSERWNFDEIGDHFAKTRYWHFKSIAVVKGQKVYAGDLLGLADNTGVSAGDHLHYELKPVEYSGEMLYNVEQNNGFFGAVDPTPYFTGIHAVEVQDLIQKYNSLLVLAQRWIDALKAKNV